MTVIDDTWWFNCKINGKGAFLHDSPRPAPNHPNVAEQHPDVVHDLFERGKADAGGSFPQYLLEQAETPAMRRAQSIRRDPRARLARAARSGGWGRGDAARVPKRAVAPRDGAPQIDPASPEPEARRKTDEQPFTKLPRPGRRRVSSRQRRSAPAHSPVRGSCGAPHAQTAADVAPYQQAKINWRQADGEQITVAVIPASYFDNLIAITPQFEALTGVKVRFDKVPPGQIRQKAMLDLSEDGDLRDARGGPDVLPAVRVNQWVDALDRYLGDASLTDGAWFNYDESSRRGATPTRCDGKPYGVPYDGEVTVQVYRKDLYDAKGLKPAETLDEFLKNAAAINDPANRVYGMALRGFAGAGQNMYIYPSIRRSSAAAGSRATRSW